MRTEFDIIDNVTIYPSSPFKLTESGMKNKTKRKKVSHASWRFQRGIFGKVTLRWGKTCIAFCLNNTSWIESLFPISPNKRALARFREEFFKLNFQRWGYSNASFSLHVDTLALYNSSDSLSWLLDVCLISVLRIWFFIKTASWSRWFSIFSLPICLVVYLFRNGKLDVGLLVILRFSPTPAQRSRISAFN